MTATCNVLQRVAPCCMLHHCNVCNTTPLGVLHLLHCCVLRLQRHLQGMQRHLQGMQMTMKKSEPKDLHNGSGYGE